MRALIKTCMLASVLIMFSGIALAESMDRIVATVNGDIILYSELKAKIAELEKRAPEIKTDDPQKRSQLERQVLDQIIQDRLAQGEIDRLKITVTQHDIDVAIQNIKPDPNMTEEQVKTAIEKEGQSFDQFKESLKKQIERSRLVDRVLKSKVVITDKEVDDYLKSEGKDPGAGRQEGGGETRRIAVIQIPASDEKLAHDIYSRLKGGADFAAVAKENSKGPGAEDGGDIGYIQLSELAPPIVDGIKGLKVGEFSKLVKSADNLYIVKVLDIKKEKQVVRVRSDNPNREQARSELFQTEMNRRFQEWARDLQSKAFIQITL